MAIAHDERALDPFLVLLLGDEELANARNAVDAINCVCVLRVPKILVASVGLVL
jgi:hypothetical protein